MADIEKTTFHLYALPLSSSNIEAAARERFSRATPSPAPGYVLIYTAGKQPDESEEITEEKVSLLSNQDEQWLFDCNAALIADQIRANEPEILEGLSESIDALEVELKRRREELNRKGA